MAWRSRQSENPLTGGDYPGSSIELLRSTLVADWDIGVAVLSSYTGYTDATLDQAYDQDYQANGRPDRDHLRDDHGHAPGHDTVQPGTAGDHVRGTDPSR